MPVTDSFGRLIYTCDELVSLLYQDPDLDISEFVVRDGGVYNSSNQVLRTKFPEVRTIKDYLPPPSTMEEFDAINQQTWAMPDEYRDMDIAAWVLSRCNGEAELQRAGDELLKFQERDLFNLLKFMKYFVDTLRQNGVVWGVGRGSSVASFVLYLIGVHRINPIYYQIPIEEFLK